MDKKFLYIKDKIIYVVEDKKEISFLNLNHFTEYFYNEEVFNFLNTNYYIYYSPSQKIYYQTNNKNDILINLYQENLIIPEIEIIFSNFDIIKENLEDIFYNKTLEEAKEIKIKDLKNKTYLYIAQYMPDWRINRWNEYIKLYEKKNIKNETLTDYEELIYNNFPDYNETNQMCYEYCLIAMQWVFNCIKICSNYELAIFKANSITEIKNIVFEYPPFPL